MAKNKNPVEMTLFDLILRDTKIDSEIIKTFRGNLTALRGYMGGIGNMKVRETFRKFVNDAEGVMTQMAKQREIIISAIEKAQEQWDKDHPEETSSNPPTTPAESVSESKPISESPKTSSAPGATEQDASQLQTE